MINRITLLLFIGLTFWSCENDTADTGNDFEQLIIGCWENEEPWDDGWFFFLEDSSFYEMSYVSGGGISSGYECLGPKDFLITENQITMLWPIEEYEINDTTFIDTVFKYIFTYSFSDDNKKIHFTTFQENDGQVNNWIVSWTKRDDLEFSQYCVE
jgi:hypothetical protein